MRGSNDEMLATILTDLVVTLRKGGFVLARRNEDTGVLEPVDIALVNRKLTDDVRIKEHQVDDDAEVSLADAFRFGVLNGPSYTSVRMKMMRGRNVYADIAPKFRTRGAETLYRAGDLRAWQKEYDKRSKAGQSRVPVERKPRQEPDALFVLLEKIRGEEG